MGGCVSTAPRLIQNENNNNVIRTRPIVTLHCRWLSGLRTMGFVVWCVPVAGSQSLFPGLSFYMSLALARGQREKDFKNLLTPKLSLVITQASGNHVERFVPIIHVDDLDLLAFLAGQLLVAQKIVS